MRGLRGSQCLSQKHLMNEQMNITNTGRNTAYFTELVDDDIPMLVKEHNNNILHFLDMQEHARCDCFQGLTISSFLL